MFTGKKHDVDAFQLEDASDVLAKLYMAKTVESNARKTLRQARQSNNAAVITEANEAYKAARVRRRLVIKEVRAAGIEVTDSGVVIDDQDRQYCEIGKEDFVYAESCVSQQGASEKKHIRLYTINSLEDISNGQAEFIAEFADKVLAKNYCKYMLGKKRFTRKGIAIAEVTGEGVLRESEIVTIITPGGEVLDKLSRN